MNKFELEHFKVHLHWKYRWTLELINVEYDIQLMTMECIEPS